jgi:hypothetical protein
MSILHVNQIAKKLKELFGSIVPSDDIAEHDAERAQKIQTRCLAAFAIYSQAGCSEAEAASAVVDGPDDNGLDAIYFSHASKTLYLAQSKWMQDGVGEPSSADIGKFCDGVNDLINTEWERFNHRIQAKRSEVEAALDAFDVKVQLIVVYSGSANLAKHGMGRINDLLSALNDASELVTFAQLNQAEIYRILSSGLAGAPIELDFGLANWGRIDDPIESYYGTITGEEVADWWKKNGERLFERNLRGVLGKTEVNLEVSNTIDNRPADFWFFNNGITVVASKVTKTLAGGSNRELGTFKAENAREPLNKSLAGTPAGAD